VNVTDFFNGIHCVIHCGAAERSQLEIFQYFRSAVLGLLNPDIPAQPYRDFAIRQPLALEHGFEPPEQAAALRRIR
jgi:hypothetical protein